MANQFSILSGPTLQAMRKIDREVQQANKAAVRAGGRAVQKAARANAPVYQGPRPDVPKGRLRRSIRAGRVFKIGATGAGVDIGPRGYRARLYAGKEEVRDPYMSKAEAETAGVIAQIAAVAYVKAMEKGSR